MTGRFAPFTATVVAFRGAAYQRLGSLPNTGNEVVYKQHRGKRPPSRSRSLRQNRGLQIKTARRRHWAFRVLSGMPKVGFFVLLLWFHAELRCWDISWRQGKAAQKPGFRLRTCYWSEGTKKAAFERVRRFSYLPCVWKCEIVRPSARNENRSACGCSSSSSVSAPCCRYYPRRGVLSCHRDAAVRMTRKTNPHMLRPAPLRKYVSLSLYRASAALHCCLRQLGKIRVNKNEQKPGCT